MTRKSTCSIELGKTSKSASFRLQAQKAYGSTNYAHSANIKTRLTGSRNQAQSAKGFKQSLKAQRATRRAQRFKLKLRLIESLHRAQGKTSNILGAPKILHKGAQETQASDSLNS